MHFSNILYGDVVPNQACNDTSTPSLHIEISLWLDALLPEGGLVLCLELLVDLSALGWLVAVLCEVRDNQRAGGGNCQLAVVKLTGE